MPNKLASKPHPGNGAKLHLKWVRSAICAPGKQKLVVKGLGFNPAEPGDRASRTSGHPRHGGQGGRIMVEILS